MKYLTAEKKKEVPTQSEFSRSKEVLIKKSIGNDVGMSATNREGLEPGLRRLTVTRLQSGKEGTVVPNSQECTLK